MILLLMKLILTYVDVEIDDNVVVDVGVRAAAYWGLTFCLAVASPEWGLIGGNTILIQ